MGFFDLFKNLFGGAKPTIDTSGFTIDVAKNVMSVNGKAVEIPCHIDMLCKTFGKARKFVGENGANVNYTWDDLGLYCYTRGNGIVHCIGIKVNKGDMELKYDPRTLYKGTLTINGMPWEQTMFEGEDMDGFFRKREFDGLSLVSEYVDFDKGDSEGCNGAYSGIEISLC